MSDDNVYTGIPSATKHSKQGSSLHCVYHVIFEKSSALCHYLYLSFVIIAKSHKETANNWFIS